MKKKILILYTSIGLGHKSIAENIGYYLEQAGYEVKLADAQKVQGGVLVSWGTALYQFFLGWVPFVWSWLYKTQWFVNLTLPYRTWVASFNFIHVLEIVNEFKPDVVISTHNTASAIISFLKTKELYKGKFGIAFSDFHLHRFWLFENTDFYLANTEGQKKEMVKLGVSADKIFVCGITLKPKAQVDVASVKAKFEIQTGEKVALLSSGSQGTGVSESFIWQLLQSPKVKVIVVCGKNKKLFESLSAKFAGSNATILGYYSPMDELYAVADIYITKPGGLSVAESLLWRLPILVSHLLPGQEELNYEFLQDKRLVMPEPISLMGSAQEELNSGEFKKILIQNEEIAKILGNGRPVVEVINSLLA